MTKILATIPAAKFNVAASLVSPWKIDEDDIAPGLIDWMDEARCVLGLGDGIGMNYITLDLGVIRSGGRFSYAA